MSASDLETLDPNNLSTVTGGDPAADAKALDKVHSDAFNTCFTTPGPTFTACNAYANWMKRNAAIGLGQARRDKVPVATVSAWKDWNAP